MRSTQDLTGIKCEDKSCAEGYYTCGRCQKIIHEKIWSKMTRQERSYDRYVDSLGAYTSRCSDENWEQSCCSCHINPPCSYCINKTDKEEDIIK